MIGLQAKGNQSIRLEVERIKTVERMVKRKQKIVDQESHGQWTPSLQESHIALARVNVLHPKTECQTDAVED